MRTTPETPLAAARTMLERELGCLPACRAGGVPVGMVTGADLVRLAAGVVQDLDLATGALRVRGGPGTARRRRRSRTGG